MQFRNRETLLANATEDLVDLRLDALSILERAVDAVDPEMLVLRSVVHDRKAKLLTLRGDPFAAGPGSAEDLHLEMRGIRAVRCISVGKAGEAMLRGLLPALEPEDAFVVTNAPERTTRFPVIEGGHPKPTEGSVEAGRKALELARATGPDDLLVVLLSGGGSALMEDPAVPLADLQATTQLLLASGASIEEMNAVRKKLSNVKGGRLAQAARGRVLTLMLSDCFGDHLSTVASGPTTPDATTHADALAILGDLGVLEQAPERVRRILKDGVEGRQPETPKPGDPLFQRVTNIVVGSNDLACHEATQMAAELDYHAFRVREPLRGSAQRAGWKLARMAEDVTLGKAALPRPACVVFGGETTVDLRSAPSPGKGGRNQEAALAAMHELKAEALIACMGTDGIDGPNDAAGALVDMGSKERAEDLGLDMEDHLRRHDSYRFFEKLGDLLLTGPTGTNVADVAIVLVP